MKAIGNIQFVSDFMRGAADCRNGEPQKEDGDAYKRGYGTQYEIDQRNTEASIKWQTQAR